MGDIYLRYIEYSMSKKEDTKNNVKEDKKQSPKTVLPPLDSNSRKIIYKNRDRKSEIKLNKE